MVKANGEKYFYHTNDLYSIAAISDATGSVIERYKYDPYGKVTVLAADGVTVLGASSVGNRRLHQGLPLDLETGLYYNRARYYSFELGRFISRDPIGYAGSKWNLYEYWSGIPMKNLDPEGLKILDIPCYIKCMDAHEADFVSRKLNITQDHRRNIWSPGCVTKCQIDAPWGDCPIDDKEPTGADCSASGGIDEKGRPKDIDKTFVFGDCCKRTCKCTKFFVSSQPQRADGTGGRPGNKAEYHWRNDGPDAPCIAKNQAAQTAAETAAIKNAILPAK
jgi:RHS repeat-associated protein